MTVAVRGRIGDPKWMRSSANEDLPLVVALPEVSALPAPTDVHRVQRDAQGHVPDVWALGIETAMNDIESVAEAIWRVDHGKWIDNTGVTWADVREDWREKYCHMAQSAIDALKLTREYKYLEDGWGGQTIHADGTTTSEGKAATRTSRLVGPWEVDKP